MQQRHKVKAQTWITIKKSDKGNQVGVVTERLPAALHFLPVIGLGSIPGRCLLIQPVGSHRLVAMSSRRGPPCCKRINVQPGGRMSLNAKTKGAK